MCNQFFHRLKKTACVLAVFFTTTSVNANIKPHAFDMNNYDCAFEISSGEQSVRRFTLTEQVYQCLRGQRYQDVAVVDGNNQLVPFEIVRQKSDTKTKTEFRELEFYQEALSAQVRTADQVRRITQLTGLQAGRETNLQWELKNSLYTSLIIKKLADGSAQSLGKLSEISLSISAAKTLKANTINAVVMVEQSNDMQRWRTLVERYDVHLSPEDLNNNKAITLPLGDFSLARRTVGAEHYFRVAILSNVANFSDQVNSIKARFDKTLTVTPDEQWATLELSPSDELDENKHPFWLANTNSLAPIHKIRFSTPLKTALFEGYVQTERYSSPFSFKRPERSGKNKVKKVLNEVVSGKPKKKPIDFWGQRFRFNQYILQTGSGQISHLTKTFSVRQNKSWRFSFTNPSPMTQAQLPSIEVAWVPLQFNFVAQGDGPFKLLAGSDTATQTLSYPRQLNQLVGTIEQVELQGLEPLIVKTVDVEASNTKAQPIAWARYALWGVLFLGLLMMLGMVRQLAKKIKESE